MSLPFDLDNLDFLEFAKTVIARMDRSGILRSKETTLPGPVSHPSELPQLNYDGSSTGQAPGDDSEVILNPQAIYGDPFTRGKNILVICDAYTPTGEPIPTNKRHSAAEIFGHSDVVAKVTWYGIKHGYVLLQKDAGLPIRFPGPEGPHCFRPLKLDIPESDRLHRFQQEVSECYEFAGIQGGPAPGLRLADDMVIARFIAEGLAEKYGMVACNPNTIPGYNPGDETHITFSVESMRKPGGYEAANIAADKLNMMGALSGQRDVKFEVCPYSIEADGKAKLHGYVIDVKMPSSDEMDFYSITAEIAKTVLLWKPTIREVLAAKSHTNPFLRAIRSACNVLKRFVTCSSVFGQKTRASS